MKPAPFLLALACCGLFACEDTPPPRRWDAMGGMRPANGLQGPDGRIWRPQKDAAQTSESLPSGMMRNPDGSVSYGGSTFWKK